MIANKQSTDISVLLAVIAQQQAALDKLEMKGSEITFCEAYEKWLNYHSVRIAEITQNEYWRVYRKNVKPFFKGYQLKDVSADDIENFYEMRKQEGVKTNSVLRVHANLFTFFTWAMKNTLIYKNPIIDVIRPKATEKFFSTFYNKDEIKQLLDVSRDSKLYTPILMAAILGMRRSEVVALKWDAINFAHKTIRVKSKTTRNNQLKIDETSKKLKNLSSYRTLPLPDFIFNHLVKVKEDNAKLFCNSPDKEFVCLGANGKVLLLSYITTIFPKMLVKNGMPRIRFHDLRHSCATMLNSLGYSMKDIQEWLGHADFSTTAKYYTHVNMKNKFELSDNLNAIFVEQ